MLKGYIAGSLFNEAEGKQRLYEGKVLREKTGDKIEWFNPIEAPINDKSKLPTAIDIFMGDTKAILDSDIIMADLTNNDTGVTMELGIAYGLQYARRALDIMFTDQPEEIRTAIAKNLDEIGVKDREIYAIASDIRIGTAGKYEGIHIPYGLNQYVIGGIESMGARIGFKFDDAVEDLVSGLNSEK